MKFMSIFFLTISTLPWRGTECNKIKVNELVAEIIDIAEGKIKFSCFKAFGKMYENLHEIHAMQSDGLIDNKCISSFKEVLDIMKQDRRRFHELNHIYQKLGSLKSCQIFVNLVKKKKQLYKKMAKMTDSNKQEKFCVEKMRQSHDNLLKVFSKVIKALRKVDQGKYTKMGLRKILKVKTIPVVAFSD